MFKDLKPQAIVDALCGEFRRVDTALGLPEHGLPDSFHRYVDTERQPPVWHMTRYFRNWGALVKLEACINRLDPFFIAVQYFAGDIAMQRISGPPLAKAFLDKYFALSLADAFRAALDVYAKFGGWFFDLNGKETMGFSYKKFIAPLRVRCGVLGEACNQICRSPHFNYLKTLRDADKHDGLGGHRISISEISKRINIKLQKQAVIDLLKVEDCACKCIGDFQRLLETTANEIETWPLGFPSPNDRRTTIDDEGYVVWPEVDIPAD